MATVSIGAPYPRLVGDVGGTHARFGWIESPTSGIGSVAVYASADHPGLEAAIAHYLVEHRHPPPAACAIGIATAVLGDHIAMTNRDWAFSISEIRGRLGVQHFVVLNDFTTLALALPGLTAADLTRVGGGSAVPGAPVGLLGPGTGLGVSGLLPAAAGPFPIAGEGGHVTLAAFDEREEQVIARLRPRFDHVSAERVLSGPGLTNLYEACCELAGAPSAALEPADVTEHALAGTDACCVEAVELFFGFLGGVAGNLALTLGARGGVYIGGGIVPQLGDWIGRSAFRARFEAKGRFRSYLEAIPTWVITGLALHALNGANRALDTGLAG
jgi:glucokinase